MEYHIEKKGKPLRQATRWMDLKTHIEQKKAATGKLTASIPFTLEEPGNRKAHLCGQSRGEEWE